MSITLIPVSRPEGTRSAEGNEWKADALFSQAKLVSLGQRGQGDHLQSESAYRLCFHVIPFAFYEPRAICCQASAYTDKLGHKTRIESDFPLTTTETKDWDSSEGSPRRYVRARQVVGGGDNIIRVRTVNGNVVLRRGN